MLNSYPDINDFLWVANLFETVIMTCPGGRTAEPAFKASYSYSSGHRGGILVNHSTTVVWVMLRDSSDPIPTRIDVVDRGLGISGNRGQFAIPDNSDCAIYLATSASSALEIRAMWYGRQHRAT